MALIKEPESLSRGPRRKPWAPFLFRELLWLLTFMPYFYHLKFGKGMDSILIGSISLLAVDISVLPIANTSIYSSQMETLESEYEFTVHVTGLDIDDESQLTQLFDEQITVIPFTSDGLLMLSVEMTAESPESALNAFKSFLNEHSPEIRIKRIDLDLVSLSQIAQRLDLSREAVRLWASGQRRQGFPAPFTSAGQSLLWAWSEVFDWLTPEETYGAAHPLPLDLIERMNGSFAQHRTMVARGGRAVSPGRRRRVAAI